MNLSIRLNDADQTTIVIAEDDLVALQLFYGDPRDENPDQPDAVMLFDAEGLQRLIDALSQAATSLWSKSRLETYLFMTSAGRGNGSLEW